MPNKEVNFKGWGHRALADIDGYNLSLSAKIIFGHFDREEEPFLHFGKWKVQRPGGKWEVVRPLPRFARVEPLHRAIYELRAATTPNEKKRLREAVRKEARALIDMGSEKPSRNLKPSSPYRGVSYKPQCSPTRPYTATVAGKHLGSFADEIAAARAYDKAAREKWGANAYQNFPADPETPQPPIVDASMTEALRAEVMGLSALVTTLETRLEGATETIESLMERNAALRSERAQPGFFAAVKRMMRDQLPV